MIACSCQDTYQHCLHVVKSFSLSYEPTPLTLQSPSTIHLHISTTASKENHNLASKSPRDQPQLQVILSQHCSSGQQEEQLQLFRPDNETSSSSMFSGAPLSLKIARMAAGGETPVMPVHVHTSPFQYLNLDACTLPRANIFSMS